MNFLKIQRLRYSILLTVGITVFSFHLFSQDEFIDDSKSSYQKVKKSKRFFEVYQKIQLRKGKLFNRFELAFKIRQRLKPLDILAQKAPFKLTDKLIPGHFGHVALWAGNKNDLKENGIWENDVVVKFQDELATDSSAYSHNLIEAVPEGVQLNSLEYFMNADDLVIIRPNFLTHSEKKEALLFAFSQIGKEYDFGFDIETKDKIVCSELIYMTFPMIPWETKYMFGRNTISPDNVVKTCLNSKKFDLISFYHKGQEVIESEKIEKLKRITKANRFRKRKNKVLILDEDYLTILIK
jgi:hypothetical protein